MRGHFFWCALYLMEQMLSSVKSVFQVWYVQYMVYIGGQCVQVVRMYVSTL
jgi:hypothetical protein